MHQRVRAAAWAASMGSVGDGATALAGDHLHPNDAGQSALADVVANSAALC